MARRNVDRLRQTGLQKYFHPTSSAAGTEDFLENIKRIVESAASTTGSRAGSERGMAELVVGRAFFRIAQHLVGLADLLEFFLGGLVVGIFVGMILDGQFAVGLFDLIRRGAFLDAEQFVVIGLGHYSSSPFSGSLFSPGAVATTTDAGRTRRSLSL